jgi:hypothetical protein
MSFRSECERAASRTSRSVPVFFHTSVLSVGAWFAGDLSQALQGPSFPVRESRAACATASAIPVQLDKGAPEQNPRNKFLQTMAMASQGRAMKPMRMRPKKS